MKNLFFSLAILIFLGANAFASDRYWVGGSGNWNDKAHWAVTQNEPGGATVPGTDDRVFLTNGTLQAQSPVITVDGNAICAALTISGQGITLKGLPGTGMTIAGDLVVKGTLIDQFEGSWMFTGSQSGNRISSASAFSGDLVFDGDGEWNFASDITARNISLKMGSVNTNGFAVTCKNFDISGMETRSLNLGSSIVTIHSWNAVPADHLEFYCGTSELVFTGKLDPMAMNFGQLTYYKFRSKGSGKAKPVFSVNVSHPNCHNELGSIQVIISSGTPGYQYLLIGDGLTQYPSDGSFTLETTHNFTNLLSSKKYIVLVIDQVDNDTKQDTMINPPAIVVSSYDLTQITTCPGDATGQIVVHASGGSGSLDYSKDNGSNYQGSSTFSALIAGTYPVRVRDSHGCQTTAVNQIITEPARTVFSSVVIDSMDCHNDNNASITITASNADRPSITYSIGGGYQVSNVFSSLSANSYTVTAKDDHNCIETYSSPVVVINPAAVSVSFTTDSISCNGLSDGQIHISASGGTSPYTYSITGPAGTFVSSPDFLNKALGAYDIAVKDYHNCVASAASQANIYEPLTVTVPIVVIDSVTCNGAGDGQITFQAAGGTPPYTYSLTNQPNQVSSGSVIFNNLIPFAYTPTIKDSHNCSSAFIGKKTVKEPLVLSFTKTVTNETPCWYDDNGKIAITASGGTPAYRFSIDGGTTWVTQRAVSYTFTGLSSSGSPFQVLVNDYHNCLTTVQATPLTQPAPIVVDPVDAHDRTCSYSTDAYIYITAIGGTGILNYSVDNGSHYFANSGVFDGVDEGSYNVIVKDASDCVTTAILVTISKPDSLIIQTITQIPESCPGSLDGGVSVDAVIGGNPPFSYTYSFDTPHLVWGASNSVTGKARNDVVHVQVKDGLGCTSTDQQFTIAGASAITFTLNSTPVICKGEANGKILVTNPSGGNGGPYQYYYRLQPAIPWTGPINVGTDVSVIAGTYDVKVGDGDCESAIQNVTVTEPALVLDFSFSVTAVTGCYNNTNGSIVITATGGNGSYTYKMDANPEQGSNIFSNLGKGTFSITVYDIKRCSVTKLVTVTGPADLTFTSTVNDVTACYSNTNGLIQFSASGGTSPYQYSITSTPDWKGTSSFNVGSGNYVLQVKDNNGCLSATENVTINAPDTVAFNATLTHITGCYNDQTGQIVVTVTTGDPAYLYSFDGGNFLAPNASPLYKAGNHTVQVRANGCTSPLKTYTLTQPTKVTLGTPTSTDPLCHNDINGTITISASGGTGPYDYSIDGGGFLSNGGSFIGLASGSHTIIGRDSHSCLSDPSTVTLNNPIQLSVTPTSVNVSHNGGNDGSITLTVSGGTPNAGKFNFSLNSGAPVSAASPYTFSGLTAGGYDWQVTDKNSCSQSGHIDITEPGALVIDSVTHVNPLCNGNNNGSITVYTSGGAGNVTYSDNNGTSYSPDPNNDHVFTFSSLIAGAYHIKVTDGVDIVDGVTVTLIEPNALVFTSRVITDMSCHNINDGQVAFCADGGTTPYVFTFGTTTLSSDSCVTFTNLGGVTYTPKVTDAHGCSKTGIKTTVVNPPALSITNVSNITPISCNGANDGKLTVTVTGGTTDILNPYRYTLDAWVSQTQGTSPHLISNITPGTYTVQVRDKNSCPATWPTPITFTEPPAIVVSDISHTDVLCFGASTGSITITASGGTGALQFSIDGVSYQSGTSPYTFTNQPVGNYTVSVRDASLCTTAPQTISIDQPGSALNLANTTSDPDFCDGKIDLTLTASGGTAPLEVSIDGVTYFSSGHIFNNLPYGSVTGYARDANGCSTTIPVTLNGPAQIVIDSIVVTNVACFGELSGIIVVYANGGASALQYSLNNITWQPENTFNGIGANSYNIYVKDINNCTVSSGPHILSQPLSALLINSITPHDVLCNGDNTGSIDIVASGGTAPYQYTISDGVTPITQGNGNFSALYAGTYSITVTDANNCIKPGGPTQINQPGAIAVTGETLINPTCSGYIDGTIEFDITGGILPITVTCSNGDILVNPPTAHFNFSSLGAGSYSFHVVDANNCSIDFSRDLTQPAPVQVSLTDSLLSCGSLPTVLAGEVYLPDGDGTSYVKTITYTEFDPGQKIVSANDIESVCLNLEHSYSSDLTITLICPNNHGSVIIEDQKGFDSYLGKPLEDTTDQNYPPLDTLPGTGFSYCFTPTASLTWDGVYGDSVYTYTDNGGFIHTNQTYIPGGLYRSEQPFSNLIGCDLNGTWTMQVKDNFQQDDGYLFSWNLNFNPSAFPEGYCNGMADVGVNGGTPGYSFEWSNGRTTDKITDLCAGDYTVTVTDNNGCQANFTTTIKDVDLQVVVDNITHVTCQGMTNGSATVHMTGGNIPYTYLWEDGSTNPTIPNLAAGTYTFTATDFNGCEYIDSVTINYQFSISTTLADTALISCHTSTMGPHTGTATIAVTGTLPITYNWSSGDNAATATQLVYGWNYVTVTDANTCPAVDSIYMDQPDALTAAVVMIQPLCNNDNNGSISLVPGGGTLPYAISWEDLSAANPRNGLHAGNYGFTLSDANTCFLENPSIDLAEPAPLSTVINSTPTNCGVSTGTAQVIPSGGVSPWTYTWSNGDDTDLTDTLGIGWHYVTVTDANLCTTTDSVLIQNNTTLAIAGFTMVSPISCNTLCDGSVRVDLSGGVQPFNVVWSNTVNDDTTINLCANTNYDVTVTDAANCVVFGSTQITEPAVLTVSIINPVNILCKDGNTGSAEAEGSGGTRLYTYNWQDASLAIVGNDSVASNLVAGTFNVTLTDAHGCTAVTSVTLTQPLASISATDNITAATCSAANGAASVTPLGGTPFGGLHPYHYAWSVGGITDSTANGLFVGNYHVTISDANACQLDYTIIVPNNSTLTIAVDSIHDATCSYATDGAAWVSASMGVAPYDFTWNGNPVGPVADHLAPGVYTVVVTDQNDCQDTTIVTIDAPLAITMSLTAIQQVNCAGASTGSVAIRANGGKAPYSFEWNDSLGFLNHIVLNADSTSGVSHMHAGKYYITITDFMGCTRSDSVTINEIPAMQLSFVNQNATCGHSDGKSVVTASGGTQPYTFAWSDLVTTMDTLNHVPAGDYTVTVTDFNLCTAEGTATIQNNSNLAISGFTLVQAVLSHNACNGQVLPVISGGNAPFTYAWSDESTNDTLMNACGGTTYTVTVTDFTGCTAIDTYTVPNIDMLTLEIVSQSDPVCFGGTNGSGHVHATGGVIPYGFAWINSSGVTVFADSVADHVLAAGMYNVVVTDHNGITASVVVTLSQPTAITASFINVNPSGCLLPTGSATVVPSGGTPFSGTNAYHYLWQDALGTNATASGLGVGFYDVTITDSLGCTQVETVEIIDNSSLTIAVDSIHHVSCAGGNNAQVWVTASQGEEPYTFAWSNSSSIDSTADNLSAGLQSVSVTDQAGCERIVSFIITQPDPLQSIPFQGDVFCNGDHSGSITMIGTGGTRPYTINWEDSEGNVISGTSTDSSSTLNNLPAGDYFYSWEDANNCQGDGGVVTINQPDPFTITLNIAEAHCGMSDGSITVVPHGGVSPYNPDWTNLNWTGDSAQFTISGLPTDIYFLTISDFNGCSIDSLVNLPDTSKLEVDARVTKYITCLDNCDGEASVDVITHTTGIYDYQWSNNDLAQNADSLCAIYYQVSVTDQNLCRSVDWVQLNTDSVLRATFTDITEPSCHGGMDGHVTITPHLGQPNPGMHPYDYRWRNYNEVFDSTLSNIGTGWYYVTVMDANICIYEDSVFLGQPDSLQFTVDVNQQVICHDGNTGDITVFASGGIPPYDFALYNQGGEVVDSVANTINCSFSELLSGIYQIRVYDSKGCQAFDNTTLENPPLMIFTFDTTQTGCPEDSTGTIKVRVMGGVSPYAYQWFIVGQPDSVLANNTQDSIFGLTSNYYEVLVTDFLGCSTRDTFEVTDNSGIDFTLAILNHPTCESRCDGSARISGIIPVEPGYTYSWTPSGETNETAFSLCLSTPDNTNFVRVTNELGCYRKKIVEMRRTDTLFSVYSYHQNDVVPYGNPECMGFIEVTPSGGILPYTFHWSNDSTSSNLYNICEGTYYLTVTDGGIPSCEYVDSFIIEKDPLRYDTIALVPPSCFEGEDGSIEIKGRGGYSTIYTYTWNHEGWTETQTGPKIDSLMAGFYYLTISDGSGLYPVYDTIELIGPVEFVPHFATIPTGCLTPTGQISIFGTPLGGNFPFTYSWAFHEWSSWPNPDSLNTDQITHLGVGVYYLWTRDSHGCLYIDSLHLEDNSSFHLLPVPAPPILCYGGLGGIDANPLEGEVPYKFEWEGSTQIGNILFNVPSGNYTVKVTDHDGLGCVRTTTYFLDQPDSIQFFYSDTIPIPCYDSCGGGITVNAQGGTGTYKYHLLGDVQEVFNNKHLTGICNGNYNIRVEDQRQCLSALVPLSFIQPNQIEYSYQTHNADCNDHSPTGSITLSGIVGGTPYTGTEHYRFVWSNGATTQNISHLVGDYYKFNILDSNECFIYDSIFVSADTIILPTAYADAGAGFVKDTIICYGTDITLVASTLVFPGDIGALDSAYWMPVNDTSHNLVVTATQDTTLYRFFVYKGSCFSYDSVMIRSYPQLHIDAQAKLKDSTTIILGDSVELNAFGDTAGNYYFWHWNPVYNSFVERITNPEILRPDISIALGLDINTLVSRPLDSIPYLTPISSMYAILTTYTPPGCWLSDSVRINVAVLEPPSGFTPNGDGVNDTWEIQGISDFTGTEVMIFNRWGERVYYSKGYYKPWDGRNEKGKDLPIGSYYFIIDIHDAKGTRPVSGTITIIR